MGMEPNPYNAPKEPVPHVTEARSARGWRRVHSALVLGILGFMAAFWTWLWHSTSGRPLPLGVQAIVIAIGLISFATFVGAIWQLTAEEVNEELFGPK